MLRFTSKSKPDEVVHTWVRICPDFWKNESPTTRGFVLYHELVHMASSAGDYGGYSKSDGARLADKTPDVARL